VSSGFPFADKDVSQESKRIEKEAVFPLHKPAALVYIAPYQVKTVRSWRNW
jgi:hypothetical protein